MSRLKELLKRRIVILDGAAGTELKKRGMPNGVCSEKWCLENPDVLKNVHKGYVEAGSDIVYTCTFGANRLKLSEYNVKDVVSVNRKLASLAKKAVGKKALIAGDIGPTGEFVKPFGPLDFEKAVNIFKEQVKGLLLGGVDLFVIETMMDIQEARAALIAVKELTNKFTIVTMTYEKHGRTLNGNDPISSLITLQSLGADAVGCNCSTGPKDMIKIVSTMKPYATVPIVAKPNAGIPRLVGDETIFNMKEKEFGSFGKKLVSCGVNIIGGCCGTASGHIVNLKRSLSKAKSISPGKKTISALSSARGSVLLDNKTFNLLGERINPTGKKVLQKELLQGKFSLVRQIAKDQEKEGASLLDVNVGVPGINEKKVMNEVISVLSIATNLPLAIDSSRYEVIESALRLYPGRALINSISGEAKKIKKSLMLAKKYGAMFILLPISGKEIPETFSKRKRVIKKILKEAKKMGFEKDDVAIDGLAMAISYNSKAALEAFRTIEWCSKKLKCNTIIGLSNISFGMPKRHLINKVFLAMLKKKGLTLAIADPLDNKNIKEKLTENLLLNKNNGKFIKKYSVKKEKEKQISSKEKSVFQIVLEGDKDGINPRLKRAINSGIPAFKLLNNQMIPAVIKVGDLFDRKEYFLPQLIASAETMEKGIKYLEPLLKKGELGKRKKAIILMATVEGDIHDIGKNIVTLMLKNHGFQIIDLGKDVSVKKITSAIKTHSPDIVGLSALMTTTMVNMQEVLQAAKKEKLKCKFMVGGAVLNRVYAASIGAEYAKDGVDAVRVVQRLWKK